MFREGFHGFCGMIKKPLSPGNVIFLPPSEKETFFGAAKVVGGPKIKPGFAAFCRGAKSSSTPWVFIWSNDVLTAPLFSAKVWHLGFSRSAGLQEPIFLQKVVWARCDFTKDPLRNLRFFLVNGLVFAGKF